MHEDGGPTRGDSEDFLTHKQSSCGELGSRISHKDFGVQKHHLQRIRREIEAFQLFLGPKTGSSSPVSKTSEGREEVEDGRPRNPETQGVQDFNFSGEDVFSRTAPISDVHKIPDLRGVNFFILRRDK